MSKPKYKQGEMIKSIADFAKSDKKWFKVRFSGKSKTVHRSFLISWQYRTLELFISRGSVYEAEEIEYPKPCPCCNRRPIRKQLHFKLEPGEDRYKCEHHEDGTLKWTYLVCPKCGRKTSAYCYEYQSTQLWNKDETEYGMKMEEVNEHQIKS